VRAGRALVWLVAAVVVVGGVGLAARGFDIRPVRVATTSMSPAVGRGDWIVVRDGRSGIQRGDIVLFRFPLGTTGRAIKRVVALAGDRVRISARSVIVEGRAIRIAGGPSDTARRIRTELVPRGHVFLLGDNAAASIDSRSFGAVPETEIVARSLLVIDRRAQRLALVLVAAGVLALGLLPLVRRG
jgi:signal peptidase I